MSFEMAIKEFGGQVLPREVILQLLKEYKRPWDKIAELEKQGKLIRARRGLYIAGPNLGIESPPSFLIANQLYGPSYVSLETALAHWQLIPERVYETASVTIERNKLFDTAAGRFSYHRVPLPYYAYGIRMIKLSSLQQVLIASPEKALCDKIVTTAGINLRSLTQTADFLLEDLRMEKEQLRELSASVIEEWATEAPKSSNLQLLAKYLRQL